MNKSKKPLAILSTAAIAGLLVAAVTTPVSAKTTALVVNGKDTKTYEYNYASLRASATSYILNGANDSGAKLYNDFMTRKSSISAFYDDVKAAYIDANVVKTAAVNAAISGQTFVLDTFTSATTTATTPVTPAKVATDVSGNVTVTGDVVQDNAEVDADTAVKAYEAATVTKYDDVKVASDLKDAAIKAVEKVINVDNKAAFTTRITDKQDTTTATVAAKVKAINDATNQPTLLATLGFFNGVDANKIVTYDTEFGGAVVNTSVDTIQGRIYELNLVEKINAAITVGTPNTVNQLKLREAVQYGVDVKVLTSVDFDRYFDQYTTVAAAYTNVNEFDTIAEIQTSMINNAAINQVNDATTAVTTAEATPNADLIAAADTAVNALPTDIAPSTTKADLVGRIDAIRPVAPVLAAKATGVQSQLLTSLQSSAYKRINANLIVDYMAAIDIETVVTPGIDNTIAKVQARIDAANLTAAQTAVTAAKATLLTSAKVVTAQALVNYVQPDVAPATTKADLQKDLNVVSALLSVDGAATSNAAGVLTVLQNNATVLELTAANGVNPAYADYYKTALYTGNQTTRDTVAEVQTLIAGVNTARAAAATTAVGTAQTTFTAASVKTAQDLVNAMPADLAPATTKADLQKNLDVVNALLAVDGAVIDTNATDASVLAALQANATVLGLNSANSAVISPALAAEYRTALTGAQTIRDTAAEVQALIAGQNDPSVALTALATPGVDADAELVLLQAKTLNLTGVIEANKAAYFADAAAFTTAAGVDTAAVQKVVNAVNALVTLNAATTSADAKTALTAFTLNVTHATSTTYINLNSTGKLELAELIVAVRPANTGYANTAAVQTAIAAQDTARTSLIADVNNAVANDTMITALGNVNYDAFNNLSASRKVDVAENFINAFPMAGTPAARVNYTSVTAIRSAIDAAIAK